MALVKNYTSGFINGLNVFSWIWSGARIPYKISFWDTHNSTLTIFLQAILLGSNFCVV